MTLAERRIVQINRLRQRRIARTREHRSVKDIDARLVDLVAQQLRSEAREDRRHGCR